MFLRSLPYRAFCLLIVAVFSLTANVVQAAGLVFVETILDIEALPGGGTTGTGLDFEGLDGARLTLNTTYDTSGVYTNQGGYAGVASTSHTVTISGSSVPANNTVFNLANPIYFFPSGRSSAVMTLAGYSSADGGDNIFLPLNTFNLFFGVTGPATSSGASAVPGGSILQSDFDMIGFIEFRNVMTDGTLYELVAASQSVVPEPSSAGLLGLVALGFVLVGRRRR